MIFRTLLHLLAPALLLAGISRAQERAWEGVFSKETPMDAAGAAFIEQEFRSGSMSARLHGIKFSAKSHEWVVIDNPDRNSRAMASALRSHGCLAGVNGGFFHPDFLPIGLVVSGGKRLHGLENAKLLSGVLWSDSKRLHLERRAAFTDSPSIQAALQSGPFLVDDGRAVRGLQSTKLARRTFVATDGHGGWVCGILSTVSLADAAGLLAESRMFGDRPVARALNLDGGSSSALWAALSPKPFTLGPLVPVRNYLGVRARK